MFESCRARHPPPLAHECAGELRRDGAECLCLAEAICREGGQGAPDIRPGGFAPADPLTRSLAIRFVGLLRSRGLARVRLLARVWRTSPCRRVNNREQFEYLVQDQMLNRWFPGLLASLAVMCYSLFAIRE